MQSSGLSAKCNHKTAPYSHDQSLVISPQRHVPTVTVVPPPGAQVTFTERAQALVHGDLHTGSVLVTPDTTHVIDAEFATYGPMAFDVGKFMANLLLAFFASDGHATDAEPRCVARRVRCCSSPPTCA